jgi:hypothetical protein
MRFLAAAGVALCVLGSAAQAQQAPPTTIQRARQAYEGLDYSNAITAARSALGERLSQPDRVSAYEILAFSYGALDSTRQAVDAFRELIFLDPNRAPDVERVSPRINALYALALGQVLVVRNVTVDSATFVSGQGSVPIRFDVSRPSRVITRVNGPGFDAVVDSQLVAGSGVAHWRAVTTTGTPVPSGSYQVVVTATEGRNEFSSQAAVDIAHGSVDTLAHLTSLPGYSPLAESVRPPRDWRPLGVAVLYAGLSGGAAMALQNPDLGNGTRGGVVAVSLAGLATGVAMSLRAPDPRPVEANIRYNQLLRDQLAVRNEEISRENAERLKQVLLIVKPVAGGPQ